MFSALRYGFKIAFVIIVAAYASVWLFSPWVANYYLDQFLDTHSLSLDDDTHIRYNPFRSRLEINSLQINNDKTEKVSALSFLSVELDLHQLIFEDVYIPRIVIKGLDFNIKKLPDDLLVAGISLAALNKHNQPATQKDSSESLLYRTSALAYSSSRKVDRRAKMYNRQLVQCRSTLDSGWLWRTLFGSNKFDTMRDHKFARLAADSAPLN